MEGYLRNIKVDATTGYLSSSTPSLYGSRASLSRSSSRGRNVRLEPLDGGMQVAEGPSEYEQQAIPAAVEADGSALYAKGLRIGVGHYHVQFFCDDGTNLRVRGTQVGAEQPGRALEWNFSDEQLQAIYGRSTPWTGQDAAWFNKLLSLLQEDEATVTFTNEDKEGLE